MGRDGTVRKRDATATRAAILASARAAFARAGYDGVGLREIAAGADVTAMMVGRYFGSKAALFETVIADNMATPVIVRDVFLEGRPDAATLSRNLAAAIMATTAPGSGSADAFNILQRSAGNAFAMDLWRKQIETHHLTRLSDALPGDMPTERAALMLAMIAGFQLMRQVIGLECLQPEISEGIEAALSAALLALADRETEESSGA